MLGELGHFALNLAVLAGHAPDRAMDGEWWPVDELDRAGLPTLFAKAAALAQKARITKDEDQA